MLRLLRLTLLVVFVAALASLACRKRAIQVAAGGSTIRLAVPKIPFFSAPETVVSLVKGRTPSGLVTILHQFWERPVVIVPGEKPAAFSILYQYDTRWELVTIDSTQESVRLPDSFPLDRIVRAAQVEVRRATDDEILFAMNWVQQASDLDVRTHSVPTMDLGFFRFYAPKRNLLAGLESLSSVDGGSPPRD